MTSRVHVFTIDDANEALEKLQECIGVMARAIELCEDDAAWDIDSSYRCDRCKLLLEQIKSTQRFYGKFLMAKKH